MSGVKIRTLDKDAYLAVRRTPEYHEFSFVRSSLPSSDDAVADGNNSGETMDGNTA